MMNAFCCQGSCGTVTPDPLVTPKLHTLNCTCHACSKKQEGSIDAFEGVLKPLWELDIVAEQVCAIVATR